MCHRYMYIFSRCKEFDEESLQYLKLFISIQLFTGQKLKSDSFAVQI